MIKTKGEFEEANIICQSIIDKYDIFSDMLLWIEEHQSLFNQINIQPKGLPGIANSNFEGIRYKYISKFHQLYKTVYHDYNILNERSHLETIIYFLEEMNSYMIGHYLDNDTIMNHESPKFYYLLGMAFDDLQYRGNTRLDLVKSYCESCNRHQYFFVGNNDGSYLHLQFKVENDIVLDVNECELLKCLVPSHIDTEKQVYLNTELPPF
jgi:hypothetical protein